MFADIQQNCFCREKVSTALFFQYNAQLGPPYQVLVDTNFINFAIKNKVGVRHLHSVQLYAKGSPHHQPGMSACMCEYMCARDNSCSDLR